MTVAAAADGLVGRRITVTALRKTANAGLARWQFRAADDHGEAVEAMLLRRSYARMEMGPAEPILQQVSEPAIYGGIIVDHYGHFLLETLNRVWAMRCCPDRRTVWHVTGPTVRPWQREIAALLGFDFDAGIRVTQATAFQDLVAPEPGFVIGVGCSPEQAEALGAFPARRPIPGRRIWVSRSLLPAHKGTLVGEDRLEAALQERGWLVFHPQLHGILTQLETMCDAEVIAGVEGSALHSLLLTRGLGAEVRILQRGRVLNPNYDIIARARGFRQSSTFAGLRRIAGSGATATQTIEDFDAVLDFVAS
ncbi:hypothetical protein Rmf_19320 [Roseomonas fluvialis]|uniref:Glycosyltransferase 61 catalytic domain-containing protein n=1 Tax=Roseomonas fluvialis TaxID=1750527 RepID=A0ABN6P2N9_9PROT|nr:hypothetical protein Rmf_19320 [Roseomonas fluvialis]